MKRLLVALVLGASTLRLTAAPVDDALARATRFILAQQDETGAIWERQPAFRAQTAMTSLSVLALCSLGHQPGDQTPEGEALRRGLAYVLGAETQDEDGYFGTKDFSRMYGHGITTLMLAEMLGMGVDPAQDAAMRRKCQRAIELILRAQRVEKSEANRGGWRYTQESIDSDLSVTVWQTMALRAARNAGLEVPGAAIEEAVRYIKRCYDPGERLGNNSGFGYQSGGRDISTTAEGLLALQVCGEYDSPEVLGASNRLLKEGIARTERWYFYSTYYYAQGMYQRGGQHAEQARRVVAEALLPLQAADGGWEPISGSERQGGRIYATCLAVLSLTVKNHFLPIYQR